MYTVGESEGDLQVAMLEESFLRSESAKEKAKGANMDEWSCPAMPANWAPVQQDAFCIYGPPAGQNQSLAFALLSSSSSPKKAATREKKHGWIA
jgi:hypothetical protein